MKTEEKMSPQHPFNDLKSESLREATIDKVPHRPRSPHMLIQGTFLS